MAKKQQAPQAPKNEIDEAVKESMSFVEKYKNQLIIGIVAVIVVVAGGKFWLDSRSEAKEKANNAACLAFANYDPADTLTTATLADLVAKHKGTDAANANRAAAARELYDSCKYEEALSMLKGYESCGAVLDQHVAVMMGDCYVALDKMDEALAKFNAVPEATDNNEVCALALRKAAEVYAAQGKKEEALKCWETIKAKYPRSMETRNLEAEIASLK